MRIEPPTVFISYSHKDTGFVTRIRTDLETRGVPVWVDVKDIDVGDSISQSVEKALSNSNYVCLVLSKNSFRSAWVEREYRAALNLQLENPQKKPKILPIVIEDIDLPILLRDIRYADFRANYQAAFTQLCGSIKIQVDLAPFLDILGIFSACNTTYQEQFLKSFDHQEQLVLSPIWRKIISGARQLENELKVQKQDDLVVVKRCRVTDFLETGDSRLGLLELPEISMSENIHHGLPTDYSFDYKLSMDGAYELIDSLATHRDAVASRRMYLVPAKISWSVAVLNSNKTSSVETVEFVHILKSLENW